MKWGEMEETDRLGEREKNKGWVKVFQRVCGGWILFVGVKRNGVLKNCCYKSHGSSKMIVD